MKRSVIRCSVGLYNAVPKTTVKGKTGNGVALDGSLSYSVRHNLTGAQGSISGQLFFDATTVNGQFFSVANLTVSFSANKVTVTCAGKTATADLKLPAGAAWHIIAVSWKANDVKVAMDGTEIGSLQLAAPIAFRPMARGLGIYPANGGGEQEIVSFGPMRGVILDDLTMSK